MSEGKPSRAPILVLGVGNQLLGDDGVGIHLLERLSARAGEWNDSVEIVEGGTQGLALLGAIAGRCFLVLLDATALGAEPGTIHVLRDSDVLALGSRSSTVHECNASEMLATALLLGDLPERLAVVGIEPPSLATGVRLSEAVLRAIPAAADAARSLIGEALHDVQRSRRSSRGRQAVIRH